MSASVGLSSSLQVLEQFNCSKRTVSSSDTDVDSAGYASSSGTTTPEDDTKMFHLGPTLREVLDDEPECRLREKPTIVTKNRNFSLALRKVKKVAHVLAAFKKKRPDDISPILISSPLRERFGKRMSVKPQPEEGFYSLPNRRFSLSDLNMPSFELHSRAVTRKFGTISGSTSVHGAFKKQRTVYPIPDFADVPHSAHPSLESTTEVPRTQRDVQTLRTILVRVLRLLFFLPWCAAVGGAILLFPSYVELVAFGPGYLASPTGIRRFAHWADCGQQHVMIFLACLVAVVWYDRNLGLSVTSIVTSRFVFVWYAFAVDKSIPLGEDDQQSLYLVMTGLASADGSFSVSGLRGGQSVMKASDEDGSSLVAASDISD